LGCTNLDQGLAAGGAGAAGCPWGRLWLRLEHWYRDLQPLAGLDAAGWVSGLAQSIFGTLVIATLTVSLGEELGWRGYLLPRLAASLGNRRGMALTGLLHGLFHMPIIFLTPFYHPDGNRWLIVPLFLAAFTVGGLLYGYLRLGTNSVWPASLAHSAPN
jgi:membrane protease YdiL (CAAX protease family)